MTVTGYPESELTPEQWRLVQQLGKSLNPVQARWISGYFSGIGAGLLQLSQEPSAILASSAGRNLTILYGTETGNCAEIARSVAAAATDKGLQPVVADMADYKPRQLSQAQDLLVIASTYGEGDPPQPAAGFFEFLEGRKAPNLDKVRFAVLALGDSTYEHYCEAGIRLDRRLEELGATRISPRVDCDIDYDEPAAAWTAAILDTLSTDVPSAAAARSFVSDILPAGRHDKRNPFPAPVIENITIVGRGSSKETRHIELSLAGSGLTYEPGDAIGITVANDPQVVTAVLEALTVSSEEPIEIKGKTITFGEALTRHYEIAAATPRFLDHWALLSDAKALKELRNDERSGERAVFLRTHHMVDIIRKFPMRGLRAQGFVSGLRPLQPRLYSIASSLAAAPDEAHIAVAPVRYTLHGEQRSGVASTQLADRTGLDSTLPVYIQANPHFRLPSDDMPIIMIGAGTGIAPYRAFLQEREARGSSGRSWLFFGERNFRTDFLYQVEWQSFLKDGVLSQMDVAFSRDGSGKTYVQNRMRERGAELFAWLDEGAHLYVCGDAAHLAPDVHETLLEIVSQQGRTGREAAEDYVRGLQNDHRYQRDVY